MGSSYVLGNREEDNQYKPYKVHPKMFDEFPVKQVACGTLHVVVLTANTKEDKNTIPEFDQEVLNFVAPKEEILTKVAQELVNKKRKREEFEKGQAEGQHHVAEEGKEEEEKHLL